MLNLEFSFVFAGLHLYVLFDFVVGMFTYIEILE